MLKIVYIYLLQCQTVYSFGIYDEFFLKWIFTRPYIARNIIFQNSIEPWTLNVCNRYKTCYSTCIFVLRGWTYDRRHLDLSGYRFFFFFLHKCYSLNNVRCLFYFSFFSVFFFTFKTCNKNDLIYTEYFVQYHKYVYLFWMYV